MASGFVRNALFASVFLGLGAVGTVAGSALATPGEEGRTGRGGAKAAMVDDLVQDLNLDAAQMAKGQEVKEKVAARMRAMRHERKAGFEDLANELASGAIDRRAIHRLADRRLDAMANDIHASIDDILDFVDTLDAQQKETLVNDLRTPKSASGSRRRSRTRAPG